MNPLLIAAIPTVPGAAFTTFVAYKLGIRHSEVEEREAAVEERRVTVEERQLDAAIRDELRAGNVVLTQQVASLTNDNALVHKNLHDVRNELMLMQGRMLDLTTEHAQCRRDLAEVLHAVNALQHGREAVVERLDQLEGDTP